MQHFLAQLPVPTIAVWTDGSHEPGTLKGGHGFVAYTGRGEFIADDAQAVSCAASYTAELHGMLSALSFLARR
eukprot:876084-Amphidinium_carterae.1